MMAGSYHLSETQPIFIFGIIHYSQNSRFLLQAADIFECHSALEPFENFLNNEQFKQKKMYTLGMTHRLLIAVSYGPVAVQQVDAIV